MTTRDQLTTDAHRAKYDRILASHSQSAANRYASHAVYNFREHTHVLIDHPKEVDVKEAWTSPFEITLVTNGRVWVPGCYAHLGHKDVIQVGDGQGNGYDMDGNCLLSVPLEWCTFYDYEDATGIQQCMDADERLLSYAR